MDDGVKAGKPSVQIASSTTKADFIRQHVYTDNPKAQVYMKSVEAHRNVLNRGLGELAAECGGAAEAWAASKAVVDAGVRGRFRHTGKQ